MTEINYTFQINSKVHCVQACWRFLYSPRSLFIQINVKAENRVSNIILYFKVWTEHKECNLFSPECHKNKRIYKTEPTNRIAATDLQNERWQLNLRVIRFLVAKLLLTERREGIRQAGEILVRTLSKTKNNWHFKTSHHWKVKTQLP